MNTITEPKTNELELWKRIQKWIMIRTVNIYDWRLHKNHDTSKRARLEAWAYSKGWLEMWPGREDSIKYYLEHKHTLEYAWEDPKGYAQFKSDQKLDRIISLLESKGRHEPK